MAGGEPQAGFQITNLRFQIEGVVLRRFDRRQAGGRGRDWFRVGRVCQLVHIRKSLLKLSLCSFFALRKLVSFFIFWFVVRVAVIGAGGVLI